MKKLAVVALGGNALLRDTEIGTIQQQDENSYRSCTDISNLLDSGHELVITHGNGPQVGNIFLRNDAGFKTYKIPKMPLDICVADSQGGIGYMLERVMRNVLAERKIRKEVVTLVTQVLVDQKDPAFSNPTKPVGGYFLKEEAELLGRNNSWVFKEDPRKRGWRRVVASPQPQDILNKKVIKSLASKGKIVITAGGGGVPVFRNGNRILQGVEAVIDKDLASSLLASSIGAQKLYILTDVSKVYINFNKENQQALDVLTVNEAQNFLEKGEFGAGSMAPKIQGAINFILNGGEEAIITDSAKLLDPNSGTKIISNN